ncbi:MAG: hypothetical protein GW947_00780 [Candidatus Pacebacteria bacterium]|nr:hypothetical protein [Candidatus Paceibacterota bacterium]PIR61110.1 MAG: hypothetical protein COU68_01145 [Candidatus Pacebacteria bacterium CG10_big_fil_rev_8_21_14_0_10_45_6]
MRKNESGFVVIVTMLIMVGLISLGLSVANQSTEDTAESGDESQAVRVFNAAEAGVEELLSAPLVDSGAILDRADQFDGSDIRYRVMEQYTLETHLLEGGTATIDLPGGYAGNIIINWDSAAALLIAIYTDDASVQTVQYVGANPYTAVRIAGFDSAANVSSKSRYQFTAPANTKMVRIKSLLAATNLIVESSFPDPQYHTVRSEATGADGVTRTIEVNKTIEVPPAILDYAVYSGGSITK